jgi:hypothetical protein
MSPKLRATLGYEDRSWVYGTVINGRTGKD